MNKENKGIIENAWIGIIIVAVLIVGCIIGLVITRMFKNRKHLSKLSSHITENLAQENGDAGEEAHAEEQEQLEQPISSPTIGNNIQEVEILPKQTSIVEIKISQVPTVENSPTQ